MRQHLGASGCLKPVALQVKEGDGNSQPKSAAGQARTTEASVTTRDNGLSLLPGFCISRGMPRVS